MTTRDGADVLRTPTSWLASRKWPRWLTAKCCSIPSTVCESGPPNTAAFSTRICSGRLRLRNTSTKVFTLWSEAKSSSMTSILASGCCRGRRGGREREREREREGGEKEGEGEEEADGKREKDNVTEYSQNCQREHSAWLQ